MQTARSGPRGDTCTVYSLPAISKRASTGMRCAIDLRVSCLSNEATGSGKQASRGLPVACRGEEQATCLAASALGHHDAVPANEQREIRQRLEQRLGGVRQRRRVAGLGTERYVGLGGNGSLPDYVKDHASSAPGASMLAKSSRSRPTESGTQLAVSRPPVRDPRHALRAHAMRRKREVQ